jgi:hypothetical protein
MAASLSMAGLLKLLTDHAHITQLDIHGSPGESDNGMPNGFPSWPSGRM